MQNHTKWWLSVYVGIRYQTCKEVSESTWRGCLEFVRTEARALAYNAESDFDDAALLELSQVIEKELEGK